MTTAPSTSRDVGSRVTRSQQSQGSHSSERSQETKPPGQRRAREISGVAKGITLGLDLGDKSHAYCALDTEGRILKQDTVANTPAVLQKLLRRYPQARVVFEVGPHSPWIFRLSQAEGHETLVANAYKVALITKNEKKSDRNDALLLARLGRVDPALLHPIDHRGAENQEAMALLRCRQQIVEQRIAMINNVRGTLKSLGLTPPRAGTKTFAKACRECLAEHPTLLEFIELLLKEIETKLAHEREMERLIVKRLKEHHPEAAKLAEQVPGVGPMTALAFVASIDDPNRLSSVRAIGPVLGLTPKRDQSGSLDKKMSISKRRGHLLRTYLINGANQILGAFGEETPLRRYGLALAEKAGKKRALIAVARKLSILLLSLLKSGQDYHNPLALAA